MSRLEKNLLLMIAAWDKSISITVNKSGSLTQEEKTIIAAITECKSDVIQVIKESKLPGKLN